MLFITSRMDVVDSMDDQTSLRSPTQSAPNKERRCTGKSLSATKHFELLLSGPDTWWPYGGNDQAYKAFLKRMRQWRETRHRSLQIENLRITKTSAYWFHISVLKIVMTLFRAHHVQWRESKSCR